MNPKGVPLNREPTEKKKVLVKKLKRQELKKYGSG